MRQTVEYEDVLRAIGHELDRAGIRGVSVQETRRQFRVSARQLPNDAAVDFRYRPPELTKLLEEARARRGKGDRKDPTALTYENILRVVGHQLDENACEGFFICEYESGEIRISCRGPSQPRMKYLAIHRPADLEKLLVEAKRSREEGEPAGSS